MSKTVATELEKAKDLIAGLTKQKELVKGKGLDEKYVKELETISKELLQFDTELDKNREIMSKQVEQTRNKLAELKEKMLVARKTVKSNFPQEKWLEFGVRDKR